MRGLDALRALTPTPESDPADQLLDVAKTFVGKRKTPDTERLRISDLQVDHEDGSQRPPDREKVAAFVKYLRAGGQLPPIKVNRRPDGSHWITDGQHRAAARAICGERDVDAYVTDRPQQDEAQETNIVAKVAESDDREAISLLLGAGARRFGKRLVLELGSAGQVTYVSHETSWVAKSERGQLTAEGSPGLVERLGLDELSLETAETAATVDH